MVAPVYFHLSTDLELLLLLFILLINVSIYHLKKIRHRDFGEIKSERSCN